jgi:hypothetical protein
MAEGDSMQDYLTRYGAELTNGQAFPNTAAKNASGPSATDGTPFDDGFISELWGVTQDLLSRAFLTPDGITEAAGSSQFVQSLKRGAGLPPGIEVYGAWNPVTAAVMRVLPMDGSVIPISMYQDLVTCTYVGDAQNGNSALAGFYKCNADGARNINGNYFRIPDKRGLFTRASGSQTRTASWTDSAGAVHTADTLYDGKSIGTFIGDASRNLIGGISGSSNGFIMARLSGEALTGTGAIVLSDNLSTTYINSGSWQSETRRLGLDASICPGFPTATENHPASVSVPVYISY